MTSWAKLLYGDKRRLAVSAGVAYLVLSLAWILLSDQVAQAMAANKHQLAAYQTYKGIFFVGLMSVLVAVGAYALERRREELSRILQLIRKDALTGLPVRAVAEEIIDRQLAAHEPFGVLLFDVRQLSRINQAFGRSACDGVLQDVAARIGACLGPGETVVRFESDKFLVIMPPSSGEELAHGIGAKVCQAFDEPVVVDSAEVKLDLWVGLSMVPRDGDSVFQVLDACERALQRCKARQLVSTIVSGPGDADARGFLELEGELRRAVRERQFGIVLQPQVDLRSFRIVGAEALVRWRHPTRGLVSPGEFIPLAESLGLVADITDQVLEQSAALWSNWKNKGLPPIRLGVNLSGVDLNRARLVASVSKALTHNHMPGRYLTLEITETWMAQNAETALATVRQLRDLHAEIALDDFGTGYSSLGQLTRFAVDCIKIDRSFVTGAHAAQEKAAVLQAIKQLAGALGTRTLAEGVETMDELALLARIGFDEAQGFLFEKPVSPAQFEADYLRKPQTPKLRSLHDRLNELIGRGRQTPGTGRK